MTARAFRKLLATIAIGLVPALAVGTTARADVTDSTGSNVHDGDAEANATQGGASGSGDAVGGQVSGLVVSGGNANLDAKNRSEDVDVTSGPADASNTGAAFVGEGASDDLTVDATDITDMNVFETVQEGDDTLDLVQTANASSGDAVGGQVIGAVVSAGTTDVVADNASEDVDGETGDATADDEAAAFVGLNNVGDNTVAADISAITGDPVHVQEGDDDLAVDQAAGATSGDVVGGQVIGGVSAGDTSIDAKNRSSDVDLGSGEATANNNSANDVGLQCALQEVSASDIDGIGPRPCEIQEGDNSAAVDQAATGASGDGVGGQVIGAVTTAGGSNDIVADNASEDVDAATGDGTGVNSQAGFTGSGCSSTTNTTASASDITDSGACTVQEGDNDTSIAQTADGSSGDGVGGQVIGSVSSGDASIDAKNASTDVDADTGDGTATNASASAVDTNCSSPQTLTASDLDGIEASCTIQEGDNSLDATQSSTAASGDGVAGEVIGAVTSAGGTNDVVAENTSDDVDANTGDAVADNDAAPYVGVDCTSGITVTADITESTSGCTLQEGDNDATVDQTADSASGDSVGGLVVGSVSAGDAAIDVKNTSTDADLDTGVATADNSSASYTGHDCNDQDIDASDVIDVDGSCTVQDGDNSDDTAQAASASTGDAVGGAVVGAVTTAGGSNDIAGENSSDDVDVATGDATANNDAATRTGLQDDDEVVTADLTNIDEADQVQDGDNDTSTDQTATATSGDGVAGLVIGSVSSGDASIDAKNSSEDVDLDTGEARADNSSASFVGLNCFEATIDASDVTNVTANTCTVQDGDNSADTTQSTDASTGDAVGGTVVGAVTTAGGSNDIVGENRSEDVDIATGEATADDDAALRVGLDCDDHIVTADVDEVSSTCSVQDGENDASVDQAAGATSGDGVGGLVIGSVSGGDTSIDAKNSSEDVDLDTGEATADNSSAADVGLNWPNAEAVTASDVTNVDAAANVQDGDDSIDVTQATTASTGDAVGGAVVGAVTSAGGSADIVAENASEDVDVHTGTADAFNTAAAFVGLVQPDDATLEVSASDVASVSAVNVQDGDNEASLDQTADAASGDGVGGMVLGVVTSGGSTSLDAKNASTDVDLDSGEATATNAASVVVGLTTADEDTLVGGADISNTDATNIQDGDNSFDGGQTASAATGDAVAGLVGGVVVAGGATDAVLDNASEDVDAATGETTFDNDDAFFVGLNFSADELIVG